MAKKHQYKISSKTGRTGANRSWRRKAQQGIKSAGYTPKTGRKRKQYKNKKKKQNRVNPKYSEKPKSPTLGDIWPKD